MDVEEATPSGSEPELMTATKRVSRMISVKTATLRQKMKLNPGMDLGNSSKECSVGLAVPDVEPQ